MPMNDGILKEDEVVFELNNKKICNLNNNMHSFVRSLYGVLSEESKIYCYKSNKETEKTDFVIDYLGNKKAISMKSGRAEIVHNEILGNFVSFLKKEGVSDMTIETICLFHYGDGTTDGTGERRMSYQEIWPILRKRIELANKELNDNKEFVLNVLDHCVFVGADSTNTPVDAIYFGDKEYGIMMTKKQVFKHIRKRDFSWIDNLHIGPLLLRPDSRYVDREITYERKRQRIVVYWPNLRADVEYIGRHYNY